MFEIKGKVAIVSGGADGIGLETVKAILDKGGLPVIADYNVEKGRLEAERLGVPFVKVDVSDEEQVKYMVEHVVNMYGKLDVMIANAGVGFGGVTHEDDTANYHKLIDVNQNGVFYCDKHAIAQFVKQGGGGVVINTSSIEGIIGEAGLAYYNMSKWAVRGLTKSLALEYAPLNIRVNSIHPGYFITGMVNENTMGEAGLEHLKSKHPLSAGIGRLGDPKEIAHGMIFLIENTFTTGTELIIDGGYTCQ